MFSGLRLSSISLASHLAVSWPRHQTSRKPALLLAHLQPSVADAANDCAGRVQMLEAKGKGPESIRVDGDGLRK